MKRAALFLSLWLVITPAYAVDYTAGVVPVTAGQVAGTGTNDNAAAGNVGEYKTIAIPVETATVTFTGTTTNLVNWTAHGLAAGSAVYFTTTGTVPSGITASTVYYVTNNASLTANAFQISTTIANAFAGTAIALTSNGTPTTTGLSGAILASTGTIDVMGLNLTAGDWNCWGTVLFIANAGTTITSLGASITAVSNTAPTTALSGGGATLFGETFTTAGTDALPAGQTRISLSATTPIYMDGGVTIGTSFIGLTGVMACRRVR